MRDKRMRQFVASYMVFDWGYTLFSIFGCLRTLLLYRTLRTKMEKGHFNQRKKPFYTVWMGATQASQQFAVYILSRR